MSRSFDLRRLRYFVRVAELGSLTRAAEALHIAQPALSHQIRILETELGIQLLVRGPRGVALTEPGERMLAEARRMFDGIRIGVERVKGASEPEGRVVLGVGQLMGSILMVPLLTTVAERLPRVRIHVREMLGGLMPELIHSGAVDFAFALDPMSGNDIRSVAILAEDLCVVGQRRQVEGCLRHSSRGRFSFRDLDGLPLYMARNGQFIRDTVEQIAKSKGVTLNIRGEVDSHHILKELALGGAGSCILPASSLLREREHPDLYIGRIVAPIIRRDTFLVYRREISRAAAAVIELAMDLLQTLVASGAWRGTLKAGALDIRQIL